MKKLLLIIPILFFLIACDRHLNQSVFTPLSLDDLKTSINKDSTFEYIYKEIRHTCDSVLKTDIDKAKYLDVTYKDILNLVKFAQDTNYFNKRRIEWGKEWNGKYGIYTAKIDSTIEYWRKFKEDNSLNQYVDVQLDGIHKTYYSYIGGIKDIQLAFKLTPLKGQIDQLVFSYRIKAKIKDDEKTSSYVSTLDKNRCLTTQPFSSPITRYWDVSYSDKQKFEGETLDSFKRDYNIYIEIEEMRKDGVNFDKDKLGLPESVDDYLKYGFGDYGKDKIASELLKIEYIANYEYIQQKTQDVMKEKDAKAFEFMKISN